MVGFFQEIIWQRGTSSGQKPGESAGALPDVATVDVIPLRFHRQIEMVAAVPS